MELCGKTALVTGSSGAIGKAIAAALVREGASVAITGHDPELVTATVAELQTVTPNVFAYPADLSRRNEVQALITSVLQRFGGRLDILVNNAGMSFKEPAIDITDEHLDYQIEVNFVAPFLLSQRAARAMSRTDDGRIVFVSSTGAVAAHPGTIVYDAMKAGLEALTRGLAVELGPQGISVNAVEPGHIINGTDVPGDPTPERLAHWSAIPLERPGTPEEVAQAVLFLVSPRTSYITGTVLRVDGGRGARMPVVVQPAHG
jgi:3-oxoacyl-[acyl-carrier protein] reductase